LTGLFGPIGLVSPTYQFNHTRYYESSMGTGLLKQFFGFDMLVDPGRLAEIKRRAIELENELTQSGSYPEPRPLNLDPGLLTLGKFMLATTKDQAHRIYVDSGVYAEVTLRYQAGMFEPWPWTYADYREPLVLGFLKEAREYYRQKLRPG
jgi:hypothetical protein